MTPQHPEGGRRRNTPAAALCHAPSRRTVPPVVTGGRRYGQPILTGSRHYGQQSLRAVTVAMGDRFDEVRPSDGDSHGWRLLTGGRHLRKIAEHRAKMCGCA